MSKRDRPAAPLGPAEGILKKDIDASEAIARAGSSEEILSAVAEVSRLPDQEMHAGFPYDLALTSLTLRASRSKAGGKVLNARIRLRVKANGVPFEHHVTCAIPLNQEVPGLELLAGDESSISNLVRGWLTQQCERVAIERHPEIVSSRCDDEVEREFWEGEPAPASIAVELVLNNDIINFLIEQAAEHIDFWKALRMVAKVLKARGQPLSARLSAAIDPAKRPSGRTQLKSVRKAARNFGIVMAFEKLQHQGVRTRSPDRGPGPACEMVGTRLSMSAHTILDVHKKDKKLQALITHPVTPR